MVFTTMQFATRSSGDDIIGSKKSSSSWIRGILLQPRSFHEGSWLLSLVFFMEFNEKIPSSDYEFGFFLLCDTT